MLPSLVSLIEFGALKLIQRGAYSSTTKTALIALTRHF
jgi:hypothetical protein